MQKSFLSFGREGFRVGGNKNPETRLCSMRKSSLFVVALAALALTGCVQNPNSPTNNAAVRTLGGAAAGAVISDATGGSRTKGALVGALIGGVSCGVPGLPACY
jgi:outer membrane lipoprotein SlyB